MDSLSHLLAGFGDFLTDPLSLLLAMLGCALGTIVGLLPGIGPSTAIALLLPVAISLDPQPALIMMAAIYLGSEYGGRIASILLNIPGDAGSVVTTLDGYPMAVQGKASSALAISAIGSFWGSLLSLIGLTFLAMPLASVGLAFSPSAFLAVLVMAVLLSATLVGSSVIRGVIAALLGMMIATVGTDLQTGIPRFTFGMTDLLDGIDPILVIIGVFGIGEVLWAVAHQHDSAPVAASKLDEPRLRPDLSDLRGVRGAMARGSVVGFIAGILPGSGTSLGSFLAYSLEKRVSKTPERFGHGIPEGVAAPEAANNSAVGGAFIPMFTLGIPGSGTTAVLLAYLVVYGLDPGPGFFTENADLAWSIIASMFISTFVLLAMNLPMVSTFARIVDIPPRFLLPVIVVLAIVSGLALQNSPFDAVLVVMFGVLGYGMRRVGLSSALLVIGIILGGLLETKLREAYLLHNGDLLAVVTEPLALVFYAIGATAVSLDVWGRLRRRFQEPSANADTPSSAAEDQRLSR
jgi:putative tricarboxylic transport membrane protein